MTPMKDVIIFMPSTHVLPLGRAHRCCSPGDCWLCTDSSQFQRWWGCQCKGCQSLDLWQGGSRYTLLFVFCRGKQFSVVGNTELFRYWKKGSPIIVLFVWFLILFKYKTLTFLESCSSGFFGGVLEAPTLPTSLADVLPTLIMWLSV